MSHHLHIISAKFPWIFLNNKNVSRKSEAVFKLIFSENKEGKSSHKYYCEKGSQGGGNPSLVACHKTLWNIFAGFRSSNQMQALNKTQPCWANCFLAASMATIPANKERGKYVNLNKFTILFPQKKSFHVIWNSQTARVMFLHINGNPFWYLHYWFLHFL